MHLAQKIYYNNKPLILTDNKENYIKEQPLATGYASFTGAFSRNFKLAFEQLEKPATVGVIIEDVSIGALQKELHRLYEPIDAAGGVVVNENGDILMIYRRGKWDLPKGKCDEGEDISECAVREVQEETGLAKLNLGEKICDTYHVYSQYGQNLLKRTAWFKMQGTSADALVPQEEENIMEAKWIPEKDLASVVSKTYEAIREVLLQSGYKWQ